MHKEYFKFSCAHFLIFPDGSKERLHGHNYHVDAEIEGQLTDKGMVIDFILVKPVIRELCDWLDEHWLLPGEHPDLEINERDDGHTEVRYRECQYLAPTDEVIVLPINNSSAVSEHLGFSGHNSPSKHSKSCKHFPWLFPASLNFHNFLNSHNFLNFLNSLVPISLISLLLR